MKIKRNTWLYKLTIGSSRKEWGLNNICAIGRHALWRLIGYATATLAVVAVVTAAFAILSDLFAWLAAMAVMGSFIEPGPGGVIFLGIAAMASVVGVLMLIIYAFASAKKRAAQASTATAIYGAVTGKFCTKIEFVD